ncbi:hypothetical protein QFC19_008652 [Naganishia cerealis]|uniref:Uncharacterized protein n=1 Tax=Naganishia cerealis TaxID=610337 RepID=A0ACC2V0A3_9TREE|nr:hypothetical protein QFC19_008652 [Naganishia cerealis]
MGKDQYKKKTQSERRRHNPIRVPDAHLGHGVPAAVKKGKEEAMLPILKKLSDPDENERAWACAAVTNLIQNDASTRRLFQGKNVVGALIERLTDGNDTVVMEALGALRNLAIDAGHEACGEMYNKNVMTPLVALVPKITATIQILIAASQEAQDASQEQAPTPISPQVVFPLTENVLTLLWCLSETSHKTLAAINAANLVPFLTAFIVHRENIPLGVVSSACQCLYALSFDNKPFKTAVLSDSNATAALVNILSLSEEQLASVSEGASASKSKKKSQKPGSGMQTDDLEENANRKREEAMNRATLIKVLIAGIVRNVSPMKKPLVENLDQAFILPLLRPLLNTDLQAVSEEVLQTVPQLPDVSAMSAAALTKKLQSDHRSPAEIKLDNIEKRLSTLMVALEVMTDACAGLIDNVQEDQDEDEPLPEDDDEGSQSEGEDEDMVEDEEEGDMTMDEKLIAKGRDQVDMDIQQTDGSTPRVKATATPLEALASSGLHLQLMALSRATPLSYAPASLAGAAAAAPSPHPPTTAVLSSIHLRALEALNNLLLTIAGYAPSAQPPLSSQEEVDPRQQASLTQWRELVDGPLSGLKQIWMDTFDLAREVVQPDVNVLDIKGQEVRLEILEILAGVWLGLAKIGIAGGLPITDDQVQGIIQSYMVVRSDSAKSRVITAVAAVAMRQDVTIEQNQACGTFFMSIVGSVTAGPGKEASTESVVTALNAIFDVYGDERSSYDQQVFVAGGFLKTIAGLVSRIRSIAKGIDKRRHPELRISAEEAYENLVAFIKYRRSVA